MNVSTSSLCRLQGFGHRYPVNCVLKAKHTSTFTFGPKTTEAYNRRKKSTLQSNEMKPAPTKPQISLFERAFWTCRGTWKRAGINTFRCLVGCTVGDFSALWALQTYAPELGMGTIMGLSTPQSHWKQVFFDGAKTSSHSTWHSQGTNPAGPARMQYVLGEATAYL
ncbi:hypothetical protein D6D25_07584 [Aureobasidium pullulans]|nr:hypothetical protein D6D25_07584 [Aureobasidium pullulans]